MRIDLSNPGEHELMLTDESSASSYGMPVALVCGNPYGPSDILPLSLEGDPLGFLDQMQTARTTVLCRAHKLGLDDNPMVRRFVD